jgi:hypothetical protein
LPGAPGLDFETWESTNLNPQTARPPIHAASSRLTVTLRPSAAAIFTSASSEKRGGWPTHESPPKPGAPSLRFFYARVGDHKSHLPRSTGNNFPIPQSAFSIEAGFSSLVFKPGSRSMSPADTLRFDCQVATPDPKKSRSSVQIGAAGAPGLCFDTLESDEPNPARPEVRAAQKRGCFPSSRIVKCRVWFPVARPRFSIQRQLQSPGGEAWIT